MEVYIAADASAERNAPVELVAAREKKRGLSLI
jgi:hypothetical protein